jgi:hypothetical protein
MRDFGAIPFAARGTVIGCSSEDLDLVDVLFDEPFPSGTNLGGRCSIMRGASVSVKYLLNVSTVCAPAITHSGVKLAKPASMSASHFAAAHDSVVLATDMPVAIKGSKDKPLSKPDAQQTPRPVVAPSASKPQTKETSRPVVAPSASMTSSSTPRVLSIAPLAPPPSVIANILTVKPSLSSSNKSAPAPSSDLVTILNSGKKKSAGDIAGNHATVSSQSSSSNGKGPVGAELAHSTAPSSDLLAILKSGSKISSSSSSATPDTAILSSSVPAAAPYHSAVSNGDASIGAAQASAPFPMSYGMMMGMHPMYMGMMPPMPFPLPGPHLSGAPVAPSAPLPVASSKVRCSE